MYVYSFVLKMLERLPKASNGLAMLGGSYVEPSYEIQSHIL